MDLILTIIADPAGTNMLNHTKVFSRSGGTVGRAEKNLWVLPDPGRIVSSQHFSIDYQAPAYLLRDTSTNGLFLNDSTNPLGNTDAHPLVDGDILTLGEYKIRACLRQPKPASNALPDGLEPVDFLDQSDKTTFSGPSASALSSRQKASQFDDLLEGSAAQPAAADQWGTNFSAPQALPLAETQTDPMALFASAPATPVADNGWDDDWWKDGAVADHAQPTAHSMPQPKLSQPQPAAAAAMTVAPSPPASTAIDNPFAASRALLDAAPLAPASLQSSPPVSPVPQAPDLAAQTASAVTRPGTAVDTGADLATALGLPALPPTAQTQLISQTASMLRETTARLIDLLRARNSVKNELRVQRTMIQSTDNNPLKFSATADDALKTLFNTGSSAFMGPADAVRDSFDDLSDHQVAVLAGMRAAYEAMLTHFSPARLEARFSQKGSLLSSKQARNWEAYCEHYQRLQRDGESTYDDLFGEEFAAAYEKQLTDLKNARALARRNRG